MTQPMALSHSRLSDFNQCPLKFKLKYIDKHPAFKIDDNNKSVHLQRGENVHKALETYLIKRKSGLEANFEYSKNLPEVNNTIPLIENYIQFFGLDNMHPERQICIGSNWGELEWFSRSAYYRAIFDVIGIGSDIAFIGDYKTGKFTDYTPKSGYGQLELSAGIALSIFDVEKVSTQYMYVDHKQTVKKDYTQADKSRIMTHFIAEHEKVNAEVNYDPCKNQFCRWCDATKDVCQYASK